MGSVINAKFKMTLNPLKAHGLEPGGRVQQAIDNAVIEYSMPYVPFETGTLARSPYNASPPGSGFVEWNTPYAHYQYMGEVYGPNIPFFDDDSGVPTYFRSPAGQKKHPTGRALQYKSPSATAFWFDVMKAAHLQDILEEARRVAYSK